MSDYTDPELRERLKEEIQAGDKGGEPGQWSARKAQLLVRRYRMEGASQLRRARTAEAEFGDARKTVLEAIERRS